jgi:hypothetical protein
MIETSARETRNDEDTGDAAGTSDLVRAALRMIDEAESLVSGPARPEAAQRRDRSRLAVLRRLFSRPPVFVLAGEFNSGKSSLCNLISGIDALPTDFLATTSVPTHLYYAEVPALAGFTHADERLALDGVPAPVEEPLSCIRAGFPAEVLRRFELIDTPGLADPDAHDGEAVLGRIRADAVIWCTPTTQAWKESELAAWMKFPARLRQATVLALTFSDLAAGESQLARVKARLEREAGPFRATVAVASRPGHESGREELMEVCRMQAEDVVLQRIERAATILHRMLRAL